MLAVGTGIFLSTIDGSIVNVALPTLVRDLGSDFATVQWVVLAYLLTLTALIVGVGRLADMSGKKHIYSAGLMVFAVGSLPFGPASSVYRLIASRVLCGCGAALLVDPYDVAARAAGLGRLVSDTALRADRTRRGVARAARFRWDDSARQLIQLYERLAI